MRPSGTTVRLVCWGFAALLLIAAAMFTLHALGRSDRDSTVETAKAGLEASAARVAVVTARAAEARQATRPALTRAESLHTRVKVESSGLLRVRDSALGESTLVPVPPLVTERIQADSVAISALSVALIWDSTAAAAEVKARDAARVTIAALERERRPRCGWRCGMILGAASVVALGIAVR
jgi:hypothetical protein